MNPRLKAVGLSLARTLCVLRDVRLHDRSPAKNTNVLSSDCVGMTSAAARHTTERGLIGAIGLIRMPTSRTAARGIARIDQHDSNTCLLCFVADKGTELSERPAMQLSALLPPSPHPRANALQFFKADRPLCAFGSLDDALADRVVHIPCEAALLAGKLLQPPPCRFGTQFLKFRSQPPMTIPHIVHHSAAVDGSIRVAGDVCGTEIDPKHVVNVLGVKLLNLARHQQIPLAAMEQQIAFTLPSSKHRPLTFAADERDGLASVKCPDRDGRIGQGEREDAVIVGNAGKRAKRTLGLLVQFVGIPDFGKRPHDHLRRQAKRFANVLIAQLLKRELANSMPYQLQMRLM